MHACLNYLYYENYHNYHNFAGCHGLVVVCISFSERMNLARFEKHKVGNLLFQKLGTVYNKLLFPRMFLVC